MNDRNYVLIGEEDLHQVNWDHVYQTPQNNSRTKDGKIILSYRGQQPRCMFVIAGTAEGLEEYTEEEIHEFL